MWNMWQKDIREHCLNIYHKAHHKETFKKVELFDYKNRQLMDDKVKVRVVNEIFWIFRINRLHFVANFLINTPNYAI